MKALGLTWPVSAGRKCLLKSRTNALKRGARRIQKNEGRGGGGLACLSAFCLLQDTLVESDCSVR